MTQTIKIKKLAIIALFFLIIQANPSFSYNTATYEGQNANYYASKKEYAKAITWLQKYISKYFPNGCTYSEYYELADLYEKNNQQVEALNNYFKAIETFNQTQESYNIREAAYKAIARISDKKDSYDLSIRALNTMIAQTPNDPNGYTRLSSYYIALNQIENAHRMSKKLIEIAPEAVNSFNELAITYYLLGDYEKSQQAIEKALSIEPNNERAKVYKIYNSFQKGDYENTISLSSNLLKELKDYTYRYRVLIRQSLSYLFLNNYDEALQSANLAYNMRVNNLSGLTLEKGTDFPVVKSVDEASEAKKSGIGVSDTIEMIGDVSTKGKSVEEVNKLLSGKSGTPITLTYRINSLPPAIFKTGIFIVDVIQEASRKKNYKKLQTVTFNRAEYYSVYSTDVLGLLSIIEGEKDNKTKEVEYADLAYSLYSSLLKSGKDALEINSNKIVFNNFLAQYPKALTNIDNSNYIGAIDIFNEIEKQKDLMPDFLTLAKIKKALAYYKLAKTNDAMEILKDLAIGGYNTKNLYLVKEHQDTLKEFATLKQELVTNEEELERKKDYSTAMENLKNIMILTDNKQELEAIRLKMLYLAKNIAIPAEVSDEIHKYSLRAEILLKDKDLNGALNEYKKALKIAPYKSDLYYNTAVVLGELQKYNEAIDFMNIYIQAEPAALDLQQAKDEIIKWELKLEKEKGI